MRCRPRLNNEQRVDGRAACGTGIGARHHQKRCHSDIVPTRKEDPGELFDWDLLAAHRLALKTPRSAMLFSLLLDRDSGTQR